MTANRRPGTRRRERRPSSAQPPTIAWVLQGGGARGAFQVGAIKALVEYGRQPDLIVGSGVGVRNACLYASAGPARLEACWLGLSRRRARSLVSLRHNALLGRSLFSPSPLLAAVEREVDFEALYANQMEIAFTVINLSEGRLEVHGNRTAASPWELRQFSRAAAAVPLLHPPVKIRNEWYVAGTVAWSAPVEYAIRRGATEIYCVQGFSGTPRPTESLRFFGPVAARCLEVAWNLVTKPPPAYRDPTTPRAPRPTVTVLEPSEAFDRTGVWQSFRLHPRQTRRLIEQGYDDAAAHLLRSLRHAGQARKIVRLHARAD